MKIKEMRKRVKVQKYVILALASTCISMAIMLGVFIHFCKNYNSKYNELSKKYAELENTTTFALMEKDADIQTMQTEQNNQVAALKETIDGLNQEIQSLSEINKSYVDELNDLRSRKELLDKYEYAIFDESGNRTSLTYAEIKLGEDLMAESGHDPNLMFGTIMVESRGNSAAVNPVSNSTGYGQFMNSTARFVWTDLLGNSNYTPDIRKDGESNIRMMAAYYDYLYEKNKSTIKVVKEYSGNSTMAGAMSYLNKINSFTRKCGVTIH